MTLDPTKAWPGKNLKHERQMLRCRFSPCGRFVVAGGLDSLIHRWELETEKKTALAGHASWIAGLAFHPTAERLLTMDFYGAVHCWPYAAEDPKPLWTVQASTDGWVRTICVSPDGKSFLTGGNDRKVRLWSTENGKLIREFTGHKGYVFSAAFHPDGKTFATGDLFGIVKHWDAGTGNPIRDLDAGALHTRKEEFLADVGGVRGMTFDPQGTLLVCTGLTDAQSNTFCPGTPTAIVFDWKSGQPRQTLRVKEKADGPINAARFLADGTLAGCGEGQSGAALWFWKGEQSEPFHSIPGPTGYDLDLHPDGLRLAAALYEGRGHTGNGRRAKDRAEYVPNGGLIRIFHLHPKTG
jgi:WD40 repeat protein